MIFAHERILWLPLIVALAFLSACSKALPAEQGIKAARLLTATAGAVMEAWLSGDVPDEYARQTLDSLRAATAKAAGEVAGEDSILAEQQIEILAQLTTARSALREAALAVAMADRARIERTRVELLQIASNLANRGSRLPNE